MKLLILNYLDEFSHTKNKSLPQTIQKKIIELKQSFTTRTNIMLRIRVGLLEARLYIIKRDIDTTLKILDDLRVYIESLPKGTKLWKKLIEEIDDEYKLMRKQYGMWKELVAKNSSFDEIIQKFAIKEYIKKAKEITKT